MFEGVNQIVVKFWSSIVNGLPGFFTGLLIVVVGLVLSNVLKRLLLSVFAVAKLDNALQRAKLMDKGEVKLWEEVLAEILRWSLVVLFLVPALEVWGLSRATGVINQFLFFLPNVIVAVVIGFVGLVLSNLVADVVRRSVKTAGSTSANALSVFAKTALLFFTGLIVLNQLGVAQDLVRILFTGIVGMLSLAGGLAFGLGGKEAAKETLEDLRKKLR